MAGQIRNIIDTIIERRSRGNPTIALTTKTKFILKGVNPTDTIARRRTTPLSSRRSRQLPLKWESVSSAARRNTENVCQTAYSTKELSDAVTDLKAQSGDCRPRAVIFFASSKYNRWNSAGRCRPLFPDACVAGCSTAGEIASAE